MTTYSKLPPSEICPTSNEKDLDQEERQELDSKDKYIVNKDKDAKPSKLKRLLGIKKPQKIIVIAVCLIIIFLIFFIIAYAVQLTTIYNTNENIIFNNVTTSNTDTETIQRSLPNFIPESHSRYERVDENFD